jgi:hypothetical protein
VRLTEMPSMAGRGFRRATGLAAAIVVAVGGWATAAGRAAERNIVVFVTDDESPTLGCYGDPVAVTPAVDALAADGTLFENAFATTASCSASRAVILSGLQNHANGQYGHQHDFHKFASWYDVVSLSLPQCLAPADSWRDKPYARRENRRPSRRSQGVAAAG